MRVLTIGNMYPPHHQGGYELMWRSAVELMRADGHQVRVLTTDHREPDPDPAIAEDADVHRELRWYWHEHEFPRLPLRRRLGLERHNRAVLDRQIADFRPDVLSWWAMGGMSMSLLERGRDAGVPAVGVVIDEWMTYGPLVDGWQRAFDRPLIGRLAGAITGVPTGVDLAAVARVDLRQRLRPRPRDRRRGRGRRLGGRPRRYRPERVRAGAGARVGGRAA